MLAHRRTSTSSIMQDIVLPFHKEPREGGAGKNKKPPDQRGLVDDAMVLARKGTRDKGEHQFE